MITNKKLHEVARQQQPTRPKKLQLNSGNVSEEDYDFFHELAARRGTPVAVGVYDAIKVGKPVLAKEYKMDECPHCHARVEVYHIFCWQCSEKIKAV